MALGDRLVFIGAGQMAEAFIGGLLASGLCTAEQIRATDPSQTRRDLVRGRFGIETGTDNAAMAAWANVVVLAVKPQVCDAVLAGMHPGLTRQLMISIAAGIRLAWLRERVPEGVRLIRVMPNAPALVGAGMSAFAAFAGASPEDTGFATRLCEAVGRSVVVEETMLDAVTGLSGSGPAYVFAALEALADGGVKAGLPRKVAECLAVGTAMGAAQMVLREGLALRGRTEACDPELEPARAGVAVLDQGELKLVVAQAVEAAARRSRELGA